MEKQVVGHARQVMHEDGCIEALPTASEIETMRFLVNGQVDVRRLSSRDSDARLKRVG